MKLIMKKIVEGRKEKMDFKCFFTFWWDFSPGMSEIFIENRFSDWNSVGLPRAQIIHRKFHQKLLPVQIADVHISSILVNEHFSMLFRHCTWTELDVVKFHLEFLFRLEQRCQRAWDFLETLKAWFWSWETERDYYHSTENFPITKLL